MSIAKPKVLYIDNKAEALKEHAILLNTAKKHAIGLDSETASASSQYAQWKAHPLAAKSDRQIIVWSYYDYKRNLAVVVRGDLLPCFAPWLASKVHPKVGTNMQFDVEVFGENGAPVAEESIVGDTVTESFYTDENRLQHGLKPVALEVCGIKLTPFMDNFGVYPLGRNGKPKKKKIAMDLWEVWAGRHPVHGANGKQRLIEYSAEDPWASWHLHTKLKSQMIKEGMWDFYREVELPFTWVLRRMERVGIKVDIERLEEIGCEVEAAQQRIECVVRAMIGKPRFNLASNKQKTDLLFGEYHWPVVKRGKKNKQGIRNPCLDEEAMRIYSDVHGYPLATLLLKHSKLSTLKNTFINGLLAKIKAQPDGICRTRFNQTRAKTGRLSSGDKKAKLPNLQNIPARKEKDPYGLRAAFKARKGKKLIVKDYGGIELVLMAEESNDEALAGAMIRGEKPHAKTGAALFGATYPDMNDPRYYNSKTNKVTPLYDQWLEKFKKDHDSWYAIGKQTNFSLNYRMSANTYAKRMKITEEEAEKRMRIYFDTYPGVAEFMEEQPRFAHETGYVKMRSGRRRRLPLINHPSQTIREHNERAAINAPIQGSAADIIKIAQVMIDKEIRAGRLKVTMLLQVHDELVFEADEAVAEEEERKIDKIMIEAPKKYLKLRVPLTVGGGIGDNWMEAK